jgi:hypothetical protein
MREAGLPLGDPVLRDALAIADQEALPRVDQGHKGLLGTVGINARVSHGIGSHDPEPWPGVVTVPGRFSSGADRRLVRHSRHGRIAGHESVSNSVDDLVHGTQVERDVAERVTDVLDQSPRGAMPTSKCTDQGAHARAITGLRLAWHLRCELSPTSLALALLEDERGSSISSGGNSITG